MHESWEANLLQEQNHAVDTTPSNAQRPSHLFSEHFWTSMKTLWSEKPQVDHVCLNTMQKQSNE